MTARGFSAVRVCVFDAYGTLFDVHSAVARHADRLGDRAGPFSQTWRSKQLEYTWLRSLMGRYAPFSCVTSNSLDYALDAFGVDDPGLRNALLDAYLELDAYPEVPRVLDALRAAGFATAILSNGDPRMLETAVEGAGLGPRLDAVISVDEIGIYKPDPRVYELACHRFGAAADEISFQSANAWDAVGAAAFGFRVLWCNRFGHKRERLDPAPDIEAEDLNAVLETLGLAAP